MKTILIIDDEKQIRDIYRRVIEITSPEGFRIIESDSAETATEHLIREKIDLILLDIKMPTIDGSIMWEVIQEYSPKIKVIVASVYPVEQQKKLIPFATDYFDKSLNLIKFLEKISSILDEQESFFTEEARPPPRSSQRNDFSENQFATKKK